MQGQYHAKHCIIYSISLLEVTAGDSDEGSYISYHWSASSLIWTISWHTLTTNYLWKRRSKTTFSAAHIVALMPLHGPAPFQTVHSQLPTPQCPCCQSLVATANVSSRPSSEAGRKANVELTLNKHKKIRHKPARRLTVFNVNNFKREEWPLGSCTYAGSCQKWHRFP